MAMPAMGPGPRDDDEDELLLVVSADCDWVGFGEEVAVTTVAEIDDVDELPSDGKGWPGRSW